jgi:hypothetical protein
LLPDEEREALAEDEREDELLVEMLADGWLDADDDTLNEELPLLLRDELPLAEELALTELEGGAD